MKFTKMQGAGNDYVYVYGFGKDERGIGDLVRKVSDRHRGIGSDGMILIDPSDKADFRMRMFNADGSKSAMCGNGIRCVGKYVYDKGYTTRTEIDIETEAGIRHLTLFPVNGKVKCVKVDMGVPILEARNIPVDYEGEKVVDLPFSLGEREFRITCVSMGNPHAILFVEDVETIDLEGIGSRMECHPFFPERTNIGFVQIVSPADLKMRVWERGTGETMACGTGACASLVAAVLNKKVRPHALVHLKGGDLEVEWYPDGHVYTTGEAETVFEGEWGCI